MSTWARLQTLERKLKPIKKEVERLIAQDTALTAEQNIYTEKLNNTLLSSKERREVREQFSIVAQKVLRTLLELADTQDKYDSLKRQCAEARARLSYLSKKPGTPQA